MSSCFLTRTATYNKLYTIEHSIISTRMYFNGFIENHCHGILGATEINLKGTGIMVIS